MSNEALRFCSVRQTTVGGVPVLLARASFSGELGYEMYCAPQFQLKLYEEIELAGRELGLAWYGSRTLMSLRLEKNRGVWGLEFRPDFTAAEFGLDAFIEFDKEFIGKQATFAERAAGPKNKLVTLVLNDTDIDCHYNEAVFFNGECAGFVSSGGYARHVGKSIAMACVPANTVTPNAKYQVEILGNKIDATVQELPLYDVNGSRMRS